MQVMIDIETLSTDPAEALILSIGAVEFTTDADSIQFGLQCLIVPDMKEQILLGRKVDRATQLWWKTQPHEAQEHWMNPDSPLPLQSALIRLGDFIHTAATAGGAIGVWANGIVFDIGILTHAYTSLGLPVPWSYNAPRDARTAYALAPALREYLGERPTRIAHDPVSDCQQQIIRLWESGYILP